MVMLNLVALRLVQDVTQQQFQTGPLHRESNAPRMRWQLNLSAWTHPLAVALRSAADALERPAFASQA